MILNLLLTCRAEWGGLRGRWCWRSQQIRPGCWRLQWGCPHLGSGSPRPHNDCPPFPTLIAYNTRKQRGKEQVSILLDSWPANQKSCKMLDYYCLLLLILAKVMKYCTDIRVYKWSKQSHPLSPDLKFVCFYKHFFHWTKRTYQNKMMPNRKFIRTLYPQC